VLPDWVLFGTVCLVPIGFMVVRSFGRLDPVTLDVELAGTVDAYRALLSPTYRPVLVRSLTLAVLTVLMCLALGTPAALALSRLPPRAGTAWLVAVMLPSFVSFTVRVFALQGVLAAGGPVDRLLSS
jgi:putative spermidine/putrescine transport system permease protein